MVRVEPDLVNRYLMTQWHKSFGFAVFTLAILRIVWRLSSTDRPPFPPTAPAWQRRAAAASHIALYVLTVLIPLSGWLMASASPQNDPDGFPFHIPNRVFDLFDLPDPFPTGSQSLNDAFHIVHLSLAMLLLAVLAVHAGAALWHQFVNRDNVLGRMIRGRG
jgi:cytochrome b561